MLKWTVSKRSDVAVDSTFFAQPSCNGSTISRVQRQRLRRRSRENTSNQLMATPQPLSMHQLIATSTPYGSQEAIALRDIQNITSATSVTLSPIRKRKQHASSSVDVSGISASSAASAANTNAHREAYATTLPTRIVDYSPMRPRICGQAIALRGLTIPDAFFGNARYFQPPPAASEATADDRHAADGPPSLKRRKVVATMPTPQWRHIDDNNIVKATARRSQRMAAYVDEESDPNQSSKALDDAELSQMIDEILQSKRKPALASGRHRSTTTSITDQRTAPPSPMSDEEFAFISHKPILPAIPRASDRSPSEHQKQLTDLLTEHPYLRDSIDLLAGLSTPKDQLRTADEALAVQPTLPQRPTTAQPNDDRSPPTTLPNNAAGGGAAQCGTPVGSEQIRRCLTFPESPDSMAQWLLKRQSVASTISTTSSSACSTSKCGLTAPVSGVLNLAMRATSARIELHVIRCKDLLRANGGAVNAYVKVAKVAAGQSTPAADARLQRTRVHRDSAEPFFNHRFIFDRSGNAAAEVSGGGCGERIQLTVWHRDRQSKRSEFLGCLVFSVDALFERSVFGAFGLQPQSFLMTAAELPNAGEKLGDSRLTEHALQNRDRLHENPNCGIAESADTSTKRPESNVDDILSYLDEQTAQLAVGSRQPSDSTFKQSLCVG